MSQKYGGRKCGSKTKSTGKPCAHPAGYMTPHPGYGRCKFHGGLSGRPAVKSLPGTYSKVLSEQERDYFEQFRGSLNLGDDLALLRAKFYSWIEQLTKQAGLSDEQLDLAINSGAKLTMMAEKIQAVIQNTRFTLGAREEHLLREVIRVAQEFIPTDRHREFAVAILRLGGFHVPAAIGPGDGAGNGRESGAGDH
ncbi:MAG: hypothetical protein WC683_04710 [bacterium]